MYCVSARRPYDCLNVGKQVLVRQLTPSNSFFLSSYVLLSVRRSNLEAVWILGWREEKYTLKMCVTSLESDLRNMGTCTEEILIAMVFGWGKTE